MPYAQSRCQWGLLLHGRVHMCLPAVRGQCRAACTFMNAPSPVGLPLLLLSATACEDTRAQPCPKQVIGTLGTLESLHVHAVVINKRGSSCWAGKGWEGTNVRQQE